MSPWRPLPSEDPGSGPRRVSASLDRVADALGAPDAGSLAALFDRWEEIVGPAVAAHARPASLSDGTLAVVCDHPGWATELGFLEGRIVERIAEVVGRPAVARLSVRVRA